MVMTAEKPITEEQANWQAPGHMNDQPTVVPLEQLHDMVGGRIISVSTRHVRDAREVLAPKEGTITAEELQMIPRMTTEQAKATLGAIDHVPDDVKEAVLADEGILIVSFYPGYPKPIVNAK